jgi:hypothetical protein
VHPIICISYLLSMHIHSIQLDLVVTDHDSMVWVIACPYIYIGMELLAFRLDGASRGLDVNEL